jgi:uncharacterized protein (DUF1800 family)
MKQYFRFLFIALLSPVVLIVTSSFFDAAEKPQFRFPYKQAGLTDKQAAAHLISRFTFGQTPGQIEAVTKMGLENWFMQQLNGGLPDDSLNDRLKDYDALNMTNQQIANTFPRAGEVVRMAIKEGIIDKDSVNKAGDKQEYRQQLKILLDKNNMKPEAELLRQLINQKILRAAYSNNQTQELLTDFWFNHFNVSLTKRDASQFVLAYERDAIRPNVTAKFEDLLVATAKSPAMLMYLDNFSSMANEGYGPDEKNKDVRERLMKQLTRAADNGDTSRRAQLMKRLANSRKAGGLNENYAREIMELHTLGVDGGYTQKDVTEAARVLTGWTIYPVSDYGPGGAMKKIVERIGEDKLKDQGYVHEGDFLFAVNRHDIKEKTVLGTSFPANGGYAEGEKLLDMLAHHPNTAKFICRKLATRFVNDNPPQTLIDKMAKTFLEKDGSLKEVFITMASAPEFWSKEALREKTKSPFELAISAVRSMNADVKMPYQLYNWINKMGQKIYYYQAPTGFPDKGQYWINTGSLLNRMNFGLAFASQRIPGIRINLLALNHNHEPESADSALIQFGKILMPERDLTQTIKQLTPLLNDPELNNKVDAAAGKTISNPDRNIMNTDDMMNDDAMTMDGDSKKQNRKMLKEKPSKKNTGENLPMLNGQNNMLTQVVGIIVGSPEFQRK